MKIPTIQFVEKGKAALTETEFVCEAGPGEVLLKTECTLISPGTEFACLSGNTNRGTVKFPMTLGYSAVARVLETGAGVTEFQPGDRCLCYHTGHRSYQRCPAEKVVKIESDTLPSEEAVFCVVGCMGFQGVRRCRPEFGESMMVMGLGLLGQFAVQTARQSGIFPLIALDFAPKRRALALESGADYAFSPDDPELDQKIRALTGEGCSSVIEITGNPQAVIQGLTLTAPGGRISLVGCSRTATEKVDFYNLVHRPGISVLGAHNMARPGHDNMPGVWTMKNDMKCLLRFMAAGRLKSRHLIDLKSDPAEAPGIYTRIYNRDPELLGVVFDWSGY